MTNRCSDDHVDFNPANLFEGHHFKLKRYFETPAAALSFATNLSQNLVMSLLIIMRVLSLSGSLGKRGVGQRARF